MIDAVTEPPADMIPLVIPPPSLAMGWVQQLDTIERGLFAAATADDLRNVISVLRDMAITIGALEMNMRGRE